MNLPGGEQPREYPDKVPLPLQPHWRQDFPTDIPEDDHVARREFVKFLVLTSGAFVAGQSANGPRTGLFAAGLRCFSRCYSSQQSTTWRLSGYSSDLGA